MKKLILTTAAVLLPASAMAHTGHASVSFMDGFAHPFFGLDHLLAMVAVGLWSAKQTGAARWAMPVTFVAMMGLGATLGATLISGEGFALSLTEMMIAASLVAFGAVIAFNIKLTHVMAGVAFAAVFALFHGIAHGSEMTAGSSALVYGAGFTLATAILHGAGYALAAFGHSKAADISRRVSGAMIAITGLVMGLA
ncbi:MAG: HupE/UreJ family protein [Oleibacter sp.]|nr:HupE/UreJ family protein [Thalassolituus sp.]